MWLVSRAQSTRLCSALVSKVVAFDIEALAKMAEESDRLVKGKGSSGGSVVGSGVCKGRC